MATGFLEWFSGTKKEESGFGIAPGTVTDNFNVLSEGRVQVHIPAFPDFDPWARVVGIGGGPGRGFLWVPQINDEVLIALNQNDHRDAYVIGGLWSALNRPPLINPIDFLTKRILQTGLADSPVGHTVEFDDALQSVKITTSTSQQITLDPTQIQISTSGGLLSVTLDIADAPPTIQIQATAGDITLSAPAGTITLDALNVEIQSDVSTDISSDGTVSVEGTLITLN
ncbi:MAG: phage baseplate assembly protein V [Terriglobia bacterium]